MSSNGQGLSGLQRNVDAIAKIEAAVMGERSHGDRVGRYLIRHIGTPPSVAAHVIVLVGWLAWNGLLAPRAAVFDPAPFAGLSLIATLEAIMLGLLILASQNRLQHEADRRAHLNLQINMMAETESTRMLHMLDALCSRFGVTSGAEELIDELKAETDPERIAESLKRSMPSEE